MDEIIFKTLTEMLVVPGAFLEWYITHHNRNIQRKNPNDRVLNRWEWIWSYKLEMQARELQTELMQKDGLIDKKGNWIG